MSVNVSMFFDLPSTWSRSTGTEAEDEECDRHAVGAGASEGDVDRLLRRTRSNRVLRAVREGGVLSARRDRFGTVHDASVYFPNRPGRPRTVDPPRRRRAALVQPNAPPGASPTRTLHPRMSANIVSAAGGAEVGDRGPRSRGAATGRSSQPRTRLELEAAMNSAGRDGLNHDRPGKETRCRS